MEKKSWIAITVITCALFITILGCGKEDSYEQVKKLSSVVKVVKIDRITEKEEVAFTFKAVDFEQILVIQHAFINPFEVRGMLGKEKRKTFKDFTNENIANRIGMVLDENITTKSRILREAIDYVPLGYYDSKEEALEAARKLTHKPKYEDWRKKEIRERERMQREILRK